MALIVGLDAATANKAAVVGSLLIIGITDNLTDSLRVHIYQEPERMAQRQAFRTTVANYAARLGTSLSFLFLFLFQRRSRCMRAWRGDSCCSRIDLCARESPRCEPLPRNHQTRRGCSGRYSHRTDYWNVGSRHDWLRLTNNIDRIRCDCAPCRACQLGRSHAYLRWAWVTRKCSGV